MRQQYRQKNRSLMQGIAFVAILDIVLLVIAFYMMTHQKEAGYYQFTAQQGSKPVLKRMPPLKSRIINKQSLLNWAAEAASAAYTYDQAHYKTQLVEVINHYFTPSGGESFQKALEESGILEQLVSQQLLVTAVVQNKPILLKSGILLGRESWKVQLPLLVTYQTASQVQQNRFIVTMMIVRTDPSQDPRGIGIDQIWVQRA